MKHCTHCGSTLLGKGSGSGAEIPAKELYDEELYEKSNILRLLECSACGLVADRYVECDECLVLVDLVLQNKAAYRHVLLNGNYNKLICKMALLSVICDGYIGWAALPNSGEFFEQEYQFYVACAKVSLGLFAFLSIGLLSSLWRYRTRQHLLHSVIGLMMAYSARFFNLTAFLLAKESEGSEVMWVFIYLLFFVATVRVLQVSQNLNATSSFVISTFSHLAFLLLVNLDFVLQPVECLE